jgi:hypothetical protein
MAAHLGAAVMQPQQHAAADKQQHCASAGRHAHDAAVHQHQQHHASTSVVTVAVDLTAGTAAGIAQLLVGHPFDTIKVRACCRCNCCQLRLPPCSTAARARNPAPQQPLPPAPHNATHTGEAAESELSSWLHQLQGPAGRRQAGARAFQHHPPSGPHAAPSYRSPPRHCGTPVPRVLQQTLLGEGLKGLYKGISAPLATVAVFNAVLFASRGQMEGLLEHADGACALFGGQLSSRQCQSPCNRTAAVYPGMLLCAACCVQARP